MLADQPPSDWSAVAVETPAATDHAFTVTGLEPGQAYWVRIMVEDGDQTLFADLNFTTSNESDTTPPEILNLAVEVVSGPSGTMQLKMRGTPMKPPRKVSRCWMLCSKVTRLPSRKTTRWCSSRTQLCPQAPTHDGDGRRRFQATPTRPRRPSRLRRRMWSSCPTTPMTVMGQQTMRASGVGEDCPASTTGPSSDVLLGLALLVVLLVVAALVRTRRAEQGMLADEYATFDDVSDEL